MAKLLKSFSLFLLVVLSLYLVSALGVSPGRTTVKFSPGLERQVTLFVLNSNESNMHVAVSVEGDLENYITVADNTFSFKKGESSKDISYSLKLPAYLSPGVHKSKIIVSQIPDELKEDMTVKTTLSVVSQLYVYVPYPGKFIETDLNVVPSKSSNITNFYIPVVSRGEQNIESVKAVIDVYHGKEKIDTINTNNLPVVSGGRIELSGVWDSKVPLGTYLARAIVTYDGKSIVTEKNFTVGGEGFEILGASVNKFTLGEIARLKIVVQNKLSDSVKDVQANLKVYDSNLESVADLESQKYDFPALSNKEMIFYWDTDSLKEGKYSSELSINYDGKSVSRNFNIDVSKDMMVFSGVGFAISSGRKNVNTTAIFGIIIGILVLLNLLWFLLLRKKMKR